MAIGFFLGVLFGYNKGEFSAGMEENKLAANLLSNEELEISPEFREYLKGRIYYNIATKYPNDRGYLLRKDWDFGVIEPTRLPPKSFAKDPTSDCNSFEDATVNLSEAELP